MGACEKYFTCEEARGNLANSQCYQYAQTRWQKICFFIVLCSSFDWQPSPSLPFQPIPREKFILFLNQLSHDTHWMFSSSSMCAAVKRLAYRCMKWHLLAVWLVTTHFFCKITNSYCAERQRVLLSSLL